MVKYVFMGWAGGIYNADMVQAGNGYIIFIYAFRVLAVEIHHRRRVTATVKSNTMKHVFMGAAGFYSMQTWYRLEIAT